MTDRLWIVDHVTLGGHPSPRLDDVSASVRPGITAIMGDSGAGKTSLLNLLVGFESPDAGEVTARIESDGRLATFWGPQDDGLWPGVSVRRHLEFVQPDRSAYSAVELLRDFDLEGVAESIPERLSRGEASRLSIARAIASEAAVLVLDEPLSHVDPARRGRYWDRLVSHCREHRVSLVFASHEPSDVLRHAEWVIGMRAGRIIFDGSVRTLYENPADESTATLLGPTNWFSEEERARWRLEGQAAIACVRPERLSVEPVTQGPVSVVVSRQVGSVTESDLRCETTGEVQRFLHRPPSEPLTPGAKVRLTCFALVVACFAIGCTPDPLGPEIEIASERRFALPASKSELPAPRDITVGRNDEKIVLDNAGRVLVYDAEGTLARQWKMPESSVGKPEGACMLADGRIVVADTHYHRVVFFDSAGNVRGMFGELGREPGQFIYPVAVTTDDDGNLYVAEYGGNDRIQKFDADGRFLKAFGSFGDGAAQFQRPSGLTWLNKRLYVADAFNGRIHVFHDSGEYCELLGASDVLLHYPYDLSFGPDGHLYIVEYGAGRVTVLTTTGEVVGRFGGTGGGKNQFNTPWGLAVDSRGRIWIADTGNRRIVEVIPKDAERLLSLGITGGPR